MDFESSLRLGAARIESALEDLLPKPQGPEAQLLEAMRYAVLGGGKRLRPFLTLEAGRLFDADEDALMRTACATECVHAYSLIHDDLPCMDDDNLRHGQPTVHRKYDEATAVLAGDALLTLAFEIMSDPRTHADPQMRCMLIAGLAKAAGSSGMVAGQMIDVAGAAGHEDVQAVTRMNRLKTGALIDFAVEAGALVGCAADNERRALTRYATDVGLAFQMVDDLLDVHGRAQDMGKAVRKDARAGKVNFVTIMGAEGVQNRVRLLAAQAKGHLAIFGPRAKILSDAVDFVVDRKS